MTDNLPDPAANGERRLELAFSSAPTAAGGAYCSNGHPACCSVALSVEPGQTAASLRGEFDLSAVGLVTDALIPHLDRPVVVDLEGLTFLDSSGIQCLLTLCLEARVRGGRLTVGAKSPAVQRVFQITGLDEHFLVG